MQGEIEPNIRKTQKANKISNFQFSEFSVFYEYFDVQANFMWIKSYLTYYYL